MYGVLCVAIVSVRSVCIDVLLLLPCLCPLFFSCFLSFFLSCVAIFFLFFLVPRRVAAFLRVEAMVAEALRLREEGAR